MNILLSAKGASFQENGLRYPWHGNLAIIIELSRTNIARKKSLRNLCAIEVTLLFPSLDP